MGSPGVSDECRSTTNHFTVWASVANVPLSVDENARLPPPATDDTTQGQYGWDTGINFRDFAHLGRILSGQEYQLPAFLDVNRGRIPHDSIYRLAIMAHGSPGAVDVNGSQASDQDVSLCEDTTQLNLLTLNRGIFNTQLDQIYSSLSCGATVFFMSCLMARDVLNDEPWMGGKAQPEWYTRGKAGEALLQELSFRWAGKDIIVGGITSMGYVNIGHGKQGIGGGRGCYPGMRETWYGNKLSPPHPREYETDPVWNDLSKLPWASGFGVRKSPRATLAKKGRIIRRGAHPTTGGV